MKRNVKRVLLIGSALGLALLIGWGLLAQLPAQPGSPANDRTADTDLDRLAANDTVSAPEPDQHESDQPSAETEVDKDAADPGGMEWRMLRWRDENGQIPPDGLIRAREQLVAMKSSQATTNQPARPDYVGSWSWLGPGNIGGRILAILIDPAKPSHMWIGSASGGIWTTNDSGTSWQPVDDFMASLAVSSLVMDPIHPDTLYAGTGEGFGNIDALPGSGIFKSINGGITWAQLSATANITLVNRLAIAPNGQVLLAATSTGIWRTDTTGNTWTQPPTLAGTNLLDVEFNPTNNQQAIAGGFGAAFYSLNGGITWQAATFSGGLPAGTGRIELAYAPSNPSIVYASVDMNNGDMWRSANGGQSYSRVNTGIGLLGGQGFYGNALWVDPTSSSTIVVGGVELLRSTDSGTTFALISNGGEQQIHHNSAHVDQHFIVSHPQFNGTSNRVVLFATDGGLYVTFDVYNVSQTTGWYSLNNNLGITQFYGAAGRASTGTIVGGSQDNGTLRYTVANGAQNWTTIGNGDGGFTAVDPNDDNLSYGEYTYAKVHRSSDGSTTRYIYGVDDSGKAKPAPYVITDAILNKANFIAPLVLDPNDANRLLVGGWSVWRTNDVQAPLTVLTGPIWQAIKSPIANNPVSAIAIAPGNSDLIWVGHNNGDVYKTTNGTAASPGWTRVDTNAVGWPNRYVTSIAIDPQNTDRVYVTFGGFSANNVWRTDNGGLTWTAASGSGGTALVQAPVNSLVVHPTYSQWIYAGTEVGIFASEDQGQSWTPLNQAPSNVAVDQLFWMDGKLTVATHGRGIYQTTSSIRPVFVSTTGMDIVGCGYQPALPCQTIQRGLNAASAGATLVIEGGTYAVPLTYVITQSVTLRSTSGTVSIVPTP